VLPDERAVEEAAERLAQVGRVNRLDGAVEAADTAGNTVLVRPA